jgi:hypothetical protein
MRLNRPNDELGTMLLLMFPEIVVPEIDISSPLMSPPLRISRRTGEIVLQHIVLKNKTEHRPLGEENMRRSVGRNILKKIMNHIQSELETLVRSLRRGCFSILFFFFFLFKKTFIFQHKINLLYFNNIRFFNNS